MQHFQLYSSKQQHTYIPPTIITSKPINTHTKPLWCKTEVTFQTTQVKQINTKQQVAYSVRMGCIGAEVVPLASAHLPLPCSWLASTKELALKCCSSSVLVVLHGPIEGLGQLKLRFGMETSLDCLITKAANTAITEDI